MKSLVTCAFFLLASTQTTRSAEPIPPSSYRCNVYDGEVKKAVVEFEVDPAASGDVRLASPVVVTFLGNGITTTDLARTFPEADARVTPASERTPLRVRWEKTGNRSHLNLVIHDGGMMGIDVFAAARPGIPEQALTTGSRLFGLPTFGFCRRYARE